MFDELVLKYQNQLSSLLDTNIGVQLAALVLVVLLAKIPAAIIRNRLAKTGENISDLPLTQDLPWLCHVPSVISAATYLLMVLGLHTIAIGILKSLSFPTHIMIWMTPIFVIFTCYAFVAAILKVNLDTERFVKWKKTLLTPALIFILFLNLINLLDDFLALGIRPTENMLVTIRSFFTGSIIIFLSWISAKQVSQFLQNVFFPKTNIDKAFGQIVSILTFYIIAVSGLFTGVQAFGVNLNTLTWMVGGLSVGLGFGMKELINNFVSGFILLFERSIVPGDFVEIGDVKGDVKEVKLRSTLIRTRNNNSEMFVPNGELLSEAFINYSSTDLQNRVEVSVRTSYKENPHDVMALLMDVVKKHPRVIDIKPTRVLLDDFTPDGFEFLVRTWIEEPRAIRAFRAQLRLAIWDAFHEQGIELPISQHDVRVHQTSS